jgi:hypothetical protein
VKRVRAFKEEIVMPNLAVYADGEFGHDLVDDATIGAYLERVAPIVPQMQIVSRRLGQQLPLILENFGKSLPSFQRTNAQYRREDRAAAGDRRHRAFRWRQLKRRGRRLARALSSLSVSDTTEP